MPWQQPQQQVQQPQASLMQQQAQHQQPSLAMPMQQGNAAGYLNQVGHSVLAISSCTVLKLTDTVV